MGGRRRSKPAGHRGTIADEPVVSALRAEIPCQAPHPHLPEGPLLESGVLSLDSVLVALLVLNPPPSRNGSVPTNHCLWSLLSSLLFRSAIVDGARWGRFGTRREVDVGCCDLFAGRSGLRIRLAAAHLGRERYAAAGSASTTEAARTRTRRTDTNRLRRTRRAGFTGGACAGAAFTRIGNGVPRGPGVGVCGRAENPSSLFVANVRREGGVRYPDPVPLVVSTAGWVCGRRLLFSWSALGCWCGPARRWLGMQIKSLSG